MKLLGAVSEGSGRCNEDHWGFVGPAENVQAAWVLDGVTGINAEHLFDAESDARWLVMRTHARLQELAGADIKLDRLLRELVSGLQTDVKAALGGVAWPKDHDPPATCLMLAKRSGERWQALRLGDSCVLWRGAAGFSSVVPEPGLDGELAREAEKLRQSGVGSVQDLLAAFRPKLAASRQRRNRPGGYAVLEADAAALAMPEILDLGAPSRLLLCTDGYYRAVDHYHLRDAESLLDGAPDAVLRHIRETEAVDRTCTSFPRLKPADDATAVVLG